MVLDVTTLLADRVEQLIALLKYFSGALAFLYVFLIFLRWRESRFMRKAFAEIKEDIHHMRKVMDKLAKKKG